MKRMQFFCLAMTALWAAQARATTLADTVKVINSPAAVVITEDHGKVGILVKGEEGDSAYRYLYHAAPTDSGTVKTSQREGRDIEFRLPFSKTDTTRCGTNDSRWECFLGGFYFGVGISRGGDNNMGGPNEIGLLNALGVGYKIPMGGSIVGRISLGVGYGGQYHRSRHYMLVKEDGVVTTQPWNDAWRHRSSNINIVRMHVPLGFSLGLGKGWNVLLTPMMNWNFHANVGTHYRDGDLDYDISTRHLHQRKLTFEGAAAIGRKGIGIFAHYCPQSPFRTGYGPSVKNRWTLGFIVGW